MKYTVKAAYAWRHQQLLLKVLRTLDPTAEDLENETAAGFTSAHSILWTACDGGNAELASAVMGCGRLREHFSKFQKLGIKIV